MLTSLLPGLRELRTPLAIGYVYALALYLLVADAIPTRAEAGQHLQLLYDAADWVGKPAVLASSAFIAYLLGAVLEISASNLAVFLEGQGMERHLIQRLRKFLTASLSPGAWEDMKEYVEHRIDRTGWKPRTRSHGLAFEDLLHSLLWLDLPKLRTRLYTASKDVYGDYDRLTAEADLRTNAGLAGIFLSCVMAAQVAIFWVFLIAPMVVLVCRGIAALRKANDLLVQAIVTDLITSRRFEDALTDPEAALGRAMEMGHPH